MALLEKEKSLVPPVVQGDAAAKIVADFGRKPTPLEVAVVQRAMKNRVTRRYRTEKAGMPVATD